LQPAFISPFEAETVYFGYMSKPLDSLVSSAAFAAYLNCPVKAYLLSQGVSGTETEISHWIERSACDFQQSVSQAMRALAPSEVYDGLPPRSDLKRNRYRLIVKPAIGDCSIGIQLHAAEWVAARGQACAHYRPVRFVQTERLGRTDRLAVAFDALALSLETGSRAYTGKIVHGSNYHSTMVRLPKLVTIAQSIVREIRIQASGTEPPPIVLNKHCPICTFRSLCRGTAFDRDDLSLLSTLDPTARTRWNKRGVLTVTQLSYTYRSPRRSGRGTVVKHNPALKALAIRTRRVHVIGTPQFEIPEEAVYLDVEGIPDRKFYHLVGMRCYSNGDPAHCSFWADDQSFEADIWRVLVSRLSLMRHPKIIHYGSYETSFLKAMLARYCRSDTERELATSLLKSSLNLLSTIYKHIYFPTYSNGLKDIANDLGFRWSEPQHRALLL